MLEKYITDDNNNIRIYYMTIEKEKKYKKNKKNIGYVLSTIGIYTPTPKPLTKNNLEKYKKNKRKYIRNKKSTYSNVERNTFWF